MSNPGAVLTQKQRRDLMAMSRIPGFSLTKCARVMGLGNCKLKGMIDRDDSELYDTMAKAFPKSFGPDPETLERWGARQVGYKDIKKIKKPRSLHTIAATQRWDRDLEVNGAA